MMGKKQARIDGEIVIGGPEEAERLHAIALTAAIQTGLKGTALDHAIAEVFSALVKRANIFKMNEKRKPKLVAVE